MADLGAVGVLVGEYETGGTSLGASYTIQQPSYFSADHTGTPLRTDGILGGTVFESGVPVADVEVLAFWRYSYARIGRTFTGKDGNWEIGGLDPTRTADYAVVIKDKNGGVTYNDAVYALVAPV